MAVDPGNLSPLRWHPMDMVKLAAEARDPAVSAKKLRRVGKVPCVLYGSDVKNTPLQCEAKALHGALVKAGESTLVELDLSGSKIPALFKDITFDPVSEREMHADFYAVNMKQEIETVVPIRLEGEAPAVKEEGGILVVVTNHLRVRCLPAHLPHDLPLSITSLAAFHDVITMKDLHVPAGVTVLDGPETVLVTVQEPRKEEELAPTPAAAPAEGAVEGAAAAPSAEGAPPAAAGTETTKAAAPAK